MVNVGSVQDWNICKDLNFDDFKKALNEQNKESNYFFGIIESVVEYASYWVISSKHGRNGFVTHREQYRMEM